MNGLDIWLHLPICWPPIRLWAALIIVRGPYLVFLYRFISLNSVELAPVGILQRGHYIGRMVSGSCKERPYISRMGVVDCYLGNAIDDRGLLAELVSSSVLGPGIRGPDPKSRSN